MKKLNFLFLFFIISAISVYSAEFTGFTCSTVLINETFDFNDTYAENGWTAAYTGAGCTYEPTPINDSVNGTADSSFFGVNETYSCSTENLYIQKNFAETDDSNTNVLYYEFAYWIDVSDSEYNNLQFSLWDGPNYNDDVLTHTVYKYTSPYTRLLRGYDNYYIDYTADSSGIRRGLVYGFLTMDNGSLVLRDTGYTADNNIVTNGFTTFDDTFGGFERVRLQYTVSGAKTFRAGFDNLLICRANTEETTATGCFFPTLFCDTFDYATELDDTNDWIVRDSDGSYNSAGTPSNNTLVFNDTTPASVTHILQEAFPVNYTIMYETTGGGIEIGTQRIYESRYAPSFTNEFDIVVNNTGEGVVNYEMTAGDFELEDCFDMKLTGNGTIINVSFYNYDTSTYDNVANIDANTYYNFKIISKFSSQNKTELYSFNTSYTHSFITLYIDGVKKTTDYTNRIPIACDSIIRAKLERVDAATGVIIDDYYYYVGFDKTYSTIDEEKITIAELPPSTTYDTPEGDEDLADTIGGFWEDFGIFSKASRYMVGVFIMFIFTVAIIGAFLSSGHSPNAGAVVVADFFLMIILIYIGMLPIWIIFIMILLAVGLGALYIKQQAT